MQPMKKDRYFHLYHSGLKESSERRVIVGTISFALSVMGQGLNLFDLL